MPFTLGFENVEIKLLCFSRKIVTEKNMLKYVISTGLHLR